MEEPDVYGVSVEDSRKRLSDDRSLIPAPLSASGACSREGTRTQQLLPATTTSPSRDSRAELVSCPLKHMLCKFSRIIDRQEPARDDRISIDIVAEFASFVGVDAP